MANEQKDRTMIDQVALGASIVASIGGSIIVGAMAGPYVAAMSGLKKAIAGFGIIGLSGAAGAAAGDAMGEAIKAIGNFVSKTVESVKSADEKVKPVTTEG